MTAWLEVV
jgi:hypothetical protein